MTGLVLPFRIIIRIGYLRAVIDIAVSIIHFTITANSDTSHFLSRIKRSTKRITQLYLQDLPFQMLHGEFFLGDIILMRLISGPGIDSYKIQFPDLRMKTIQRQLPD